MDYYNIGAAPWSEPCAQVGQVDYREQAGKECRAFIRQIRRVIGPESPGAALIIKAFPHDFGSYFEVCCRFSEEQPVAEAYAYSADGHRQLETWDDLARCELGLPISTPSPVEP